MISLALAFGEEVVIPQSFDFWGQDLVLLSYGYQSPGLPALDDLIPVEPLGIVFLVVRWRHRDGLAGRGAPDPYV